MQVEDVHAVEYFLIYLYILTWPDWGQFRAEVLVKNNVHAAEDGIAVVAGESKLKPQEHLPKFNTVPPNESWESAFPILKHAVVYEEAGLKDLAIYRLQRAVTYQSLLSRNHELMTNIWSLQIEEPKVSSLKRHLANIVHANLDAFTSEDSFRDASKLMPSFIWSLLQREQCKRVYLSRKLAKVTGQKLPQTPLTNKLETGQKTSAWRPGDLPLRCLVQRSLVQSTAILYPLHPTSVPDNPQKTPTCLSMVMACQTYMFVGPSFEDEDAAQSPKSSYNVAKDNTSNHDPQ